MSVLKPRRLALSVAALTAAAALLLGPAGPARAAEITVDTLDAAKSTDQNCALIEAIEAANTNTAVDACAAGSADGVDVISIEAPGVIKVPSGGFEITSDIKIQGHGAGAGTTIDGTGVTAGFGFDVTVGVGGGRVTPSAVTLADLTITKVEGDGVRITDQTNTSSVIGRYDITLENLHVHRNKSGIDYAVGLGAVAPGRVRVVDSLVERNSRDSGIKMSACNVTADARELEVVNTVIRSNRSGSGGGGLSVACGDVKVVDSTITGNAALTGGGFHVWLGGRAATDPRAIFAAKLINTTVTGNTAELVRHRGGPGGVKADGGDGHSANLALSIVHSTITANTDTGFIEVVNGVQTAGEVDLSIKNTVVADNEDSQCSFGQAPSGDEKAGNASSDESCGFAKQDVSPDLEALADNGGARPIGPNGGSGYVRTRAIGKASALFNAADASACENTPNAGVSKDARGVTRPQGSGCDIGAYEAKHLDVEGVVWSDSDGDRSRDPGERGIAGVLVELVEDGSVIGADTTNSSGEYGIEGRLPGDWAVRVSATNAALSGYLATTPVSAQREVELSATSVPPSDFGYRVAAAFGGSVWSDDDGDGARDQGERGVRGATVRLADPSGTAVSGVAAAVTDESGEYGFSGIAPGSYRVKVEPPSGYKLTTSGTDSDVNASTGMSETFTLDWGRNDVSVDAGVYRLEPPGPEPSPAVVLAKTASAKAPVRVGDKISFFFKVSNSGNTTLSEISVTDPKAKATCPHETLAPKASMTCEASYEVSSTDVKAGQVTNAASVTAIAPDGRKASSTDSVSLDLESGKATADRLAGKDRYSTAAVISKETFSPGVDAVYIATGANFPDALAGSAASGGDGPILLVTKGAVPSVTAAELKRLKPRRIVVLGGTGVVSEAVEAALRRQAPTTRQSGSDRYSTAAAVSAEHFKPGSPVAFVATGEDFPDALTGGPAAAEAGGPILLTRKAKLPSAAVSELKRLKPRRIVVLGGTGVVSAAVEKALASYTSGEVSRLAGSDRYSTGAEISEDGFSEGVSVAYVATGLNFPGALAGGAAGALREGPVLLVSGGGIPKATKDELVRLKPKRIVVLGGVAVVPETVREALSPYIR